MKKACSKCELEKEETEFSFRNKAKGIKHAICKTCQSVAHRRFYDKDKARYKARARLSKEKYVKRNYLATLEYLQEHPCSDCGNTDITILQFHHIRDKEADVSSLVILGCSLKRIKAEIAKCVVLCPNCHRKETLKGYGGHPFEKYGWI